MQENRNEEKTENRNIGKTRKNGLNKNKLVFIRISIKNYRSLTKIITSPYNGTVN